jgi:hypothetical protein
MRYLPADDCDINTLADELIKNELIVIYEVDGKKYAEIPSFKNHQVINNREQDSIIPSRLSRVEVATRTAYIEHLGREGKGSIYDASKTLDKNTEPKEVKKSPLQILIGLDVPEQIAKDWLIVRKGKKAAFTETALTEIQREAEKAGITLAQAVEICAKKSWQGFKASWDWKDCVSVTTENKPFDMNEFLKAHS